MPAVAAGAESVTGTMKVRSADRSVTVRSPMRSRDTARSSLTTVTVAVPVLTVAFTGAETVTPNTSSASTRLSPKT